MAIYQVRVGVPACLREREPGPNRNRAIHRVLQYSQAAFEPAGAHTRCGVQRLGATAFGRGSLTPQDPLINLRNLFRSTGPALYSRLTELFGTGLCQPTPHSRLAQSHVPAHLADMEPLDADHLNDLQLEARVKDSSG